MNIKPIYLICVLFVIGALVFLGFVLGQELYEPKVVYDIIKTPQIVEVTDYIPVYSHTFIDREVEVEKIVVKEIVIIEEARFFISLEELKSWLAKDDTDSHIFIRGDEQGIVRFNDCCEDFAMQLQERALSDGFLISTELEFGDKIPFTSLIFKPNDLHMFNTAIIPFENSVYWIEPSTDEVVFYCNLD